MISTLNSTDGRLAQAGGARELRLGKTTRDASDAELSSEACGEVA